MVSGASSRKSKYPHPRGERAFACQSRLCLSTISRISGSAGGASRAIPTASWHGCRAFLQTAGVGCIEMIQRIACLYGASRRSRQDDAGRKVNCIVFGHAAGAQQDGSPANPLCRMDGEKAAALGCHSPASRKMIVRFRMLQYCKVAPLGAINSWNFAAAAPVCMETSAFRRHCSSVPKPARESFLREPEAQLRQICRSPAAEGFVGLLHFQRFPSAAPGAGSYLSGSQRFPGRCARRWKPWRRPAFGRLQGSS